MSSKSARTLAVAGGLLAVVLGVFGQTVEHGFLNYDDDDYVYENPVVRQGLSRDGVATAFKTVHSFTWHPLTTISHMLDCEIYGLDPSGHHLTSVLIHAATAILLFLVLQQMTGAFWRSGLVALVFAIHPLRVESVAWISERKDVLSGLFFMLTLAAYTHYVRGKLSGSRFPIGRYLIALACFALGLLSKPMLVTLPFLLLLLDYWPLDRLGDRSGSLRDLGPRVLEKIPFLALSAACGAITLASQKGAMTSTEALSLSERIGNALVAYLIYFRQLFVPVDLALVYPHSGGSPPFWEVALAALLLAGLTVAALAQRATRPYLVVGWLWFAGMLVPVIGLVQVGIQAHADRYTYLPHVGLLLAVTWGVAAMSPSRSLSRRWWVAVAVAVVAVLTVLAWYQTGRWQSSESIWRHTLAGTSNNSVAHAQLGVALERQGKIAQAEEHFRAALAIQADYATPRYNLGNILAGRGDLAGAIEQYRLAVKARPDYAKAHNNLGAALLARRRPAEAIDAFKRALQAAPSYAEAHVNLASALAAAGNLDEARAHYLLALRFQPASAKARGGLGSVLVREGKLDEAVAHYREALELDPDNAGVHGDLGIALGMQKQLGPAIEHLGRAADLEPESAIRHGNLAMALEQQGDRSRAFVHYQRALELAEARGDDRLVPVLRKRLERYR